MRPRLRLLRFVAPGNGYIHICAQIETTSTGAPTTVPTTPLPSTCATGSSPSVYDPERGRYAAYLLKMDGTARTIDFDPIQFLVGSEAITAWQNHNPGATGGPPNDYYIVNASQRAVEARVSTAVIVWQVRLEETGSADLKAGTFVGLVAYLAAHRTGTALLSDRPFWLTLANGEITTICEQYVP